MPAASLVELLDFVLAHRPDINNLVPDRTALEVLARRLPPLPQAGLELRLTSTNQAVTDLQMMLRNQVDVQHLRQWLRDQWPLVDTPPLPAAWTALHQALDDGLTENLPWRDFWLELDGGSPGQWPPLSVFIRLDPDHDGPPLATQLLAWLTRMKATPCAALETALRRCLAACAGEQRLTHLGWMPGRPGSTLRVIIEGCTWETDAAYLMRAGWPGDPHAWRHTMLPLQAEIDRWRLAISLHEDGSVAPTVGLECFLGDPTVHDPRWERLLQQGVRQGWWTAAAVQALSHWPGQLTPPAARLPWPDTLLLDALIDGDEPPAVLDLRLSHLKLRSDGHSLDGAKGYVGFLRVRPTATPAPASSGTVNPIDQGTSRSTGIEGALGYLLAARSPSGWWQDYDGFSEGVSDEWVTAFVACALAGLDQPASRTAAERAWALLASRGRQGWGWNAVQPPDADSTAWALRLAHALGQHGTSTACDGLAFLLDHLLSDGPAAGGVTTYEPRHHAHHGGAPDCQPDWFKPHDCVTAAVAGLGVATNWHALRGTVSYLQRQQGPQGNWSAYWWPDPAYATACAVQALASDDTQASRLACALAADWARRSLSLPSASDLSAFSLALRLEVLWHAGGADDAALLTLGCQRLLALQQPDGSWPAGAALAIPNREGRVVPALDHRRTMTTAIVLQTLTRLPPGDAPESADH